MKAACYSEFGAAKDVLRVQQVDKPDVLPGSVLVKMHYSAVNPSDVKARAGARPGVIKPAFANIIPHSDGSGVIEALGKGVDELNVGQRVWVWNAQWRRAFGTAAEYVVLPASQVVILPDCIDIEYGAVLGIPGLTAMHAVLCQGEVKGQTLLVSGGAGIVGNLAIQMAKYFGARVIATASGAAGISRAKHADADHVLDYKSPNLAEQILDVNDGKLIDRAIEVEFGRNIQTLSKVISENGSITSYGSSQVMTPSLPFYPLMFRNISIQLMLVYLLNPEQRANAITHLTRLLEDKALSFYIDSTWQLSQITKAHERVESGARTGAVLISML